MFQNFLFDYTISTAHWLSSTLWIHLEISYYILIGLEKRSLHYASHYLDWTIIKGQICLCSNLGSVTYQLCDLGKLLCLSFLIYEVWVKVQDTVLRGTQDPPLMLAAVIILFVLELVILYVNTYINIPVWICYLDAFQ